MAHLMEKYESLRDPLDIKQIFFTTLELLGFDAGAMEVKNKIPFNKNMFDLPNKRGAEVVLYFLFNRLNPVMCREEFRDSWPITDKKQEQQFRRSCNNWLTNISKNEPEAHLPRIAASLFMSPGGDKFYQLVFHLSRYILQQVTENDNGVKSREQLKYPVLTPQNTQLADVMAKACQCAVVRHRKKFLDEAQHILLINKEWKDYADDIVKEHRRLNKEIREVEHDIRTEIQKSSEQGLVRGSPMVKKRRSNSYEQDFDPHSIKRAQRVQQVREMWKHLEDFQTTEAAEREVIESIVERSLSKYNIDASNINVKVPDLLLRECEEEIRRRNVDNTYQSGDLNLISLLQLWNLCLHLYIEKIHQAGVPKFDESIGTITTQVHSHQAYLANTKALRQQMSEILPALKSSVDQIRERLNAKPFVQSTPKNIRATSIGVGLTEPSPPLSFTPKAETHGQTPKGLVVDKTPEEVSTPEAAAQIAEGVSSQVRKSSMKLFQGSPVYAPRIGHHGQPTGMNKVPASKLPRTNGTSKPRQKPGGGTPRRTATGSGIVDEGPRPSFETTSETDRTKSQDDRVTDPHTPRSMKSDRSLHSVSSEPRTKIQTSVENDIFQDQDFKLSPRVQPLDQSLTMDELQNDSKIFDGRRSMTDILVDEIMGEAPVLSPVRTGQSGFETRDKIAHSPIASKMEKVWQETESPRSVNLNMSAHSQTSIGSHHEKGLGMPITPDNQSPRSVNLNTSVHSQTSIGSHHKKGLGMPITPDNQSPRSFKSDHSARSRSSAVSQHSRELNVPVTGSADSPRALLADQSPRSLKSDHSAWSTTSDTLQQSRRLDDHDKLNQEQSPRVAIDRKSPQSLKSNHSGRSQASDTLQQSGGSGRPVRQEQKQSPRGAIKNNSPQSLKSNHSGKSEGSRHLSMSGSSGNDSLSFDTRAEKTETVEGKTLKMDHDRSPRAGPSSFIQDRNLLKEQIPDFPQMPIASEVRRMFQEAMADEQTTLPFNRTGTKTAVYGREENFTNSDGTAKPLNKQGRISAPDLNDDFEDEILEDIRMPNMILDDSVEDMFATKSPAARTKPDPFSSVDSSDLGSLRTGDRAKALFAQGLVDEEAVPLISFSPRLDTHSATRHTGFPAEMVITMIPEMQAPAARTEVQTLSGPQIKEIDDEELETFLLTSKGENNNQANISDSDDDEVQFKDPTLSKKSNQSVSLSRNGHDEGVNKSRTREIFSPGMVQVEGSPSPRHVTNKEVNGNKITQVKRNVSDVYVDNILNIQDEDLDLLGSFDESFAPLRNGFQVDGGTPVKKSSGVHHHSAPMTVINPSFEENEEEEENEGGDDPLARFQKFQQIASKVRQDHNFQDGNKES